MPSKVASSLGLVEFGFHIVFELSDAPDCRVTFGEELRPYRPGVAGQRSVVEFDEAIEGATDLVIGQPAVQFDDRVAIRVAQRSGP